MDFVLFLYGTKEDALVAIRNYSDEVAIEMLEKSDYLIVDLFIPFLQSDYSLREGDDFSYQNQNLDLKLTYKCVQDYRNIYAIITSITYYDGSKRTKIPFFQLLAIAFENYCKLIETPNVVRF